MKTSSVSEPLRGRSARECQRRCRGARRLQRYVAVTSVPYTKGKRRTVEDGVPDRGGEKIEAEHCVGRDGTLPFRKTSPAQSRARRKREYKGIMRAISSPSRSRKETSRARDNGPALVTWWCCYHVIGRSSWPSVPLPRLPSELA